MTYNHTKLVKLSQLYFVRSICLVVLMTILLHVGMLPAATTAHTLRGNETDRIALLAMKSEIINDPNGALSSWNNSFHFCEWQGITCGHRHQRVTFIDLGASGLVGSLSPYVGNLSFLRQLDLSNNTFRGEIPTEIGNLFRVEALFLDQNSFEGQIPASLSLCLNLVALNVGYNKLTGSFPKLLTSMVNLQRLGVPWNNLTGGIPPFIGNITYLYTLSAAGNPLGGSVPETMGQLKYLRLLELGGTQLSGMIPPTVYNLSLLKVFSVAGNQLSGSLPESFGFMFPQLQYLQIYGNQFTGPLPLSLSNSSELVSIEVSDNSFSGKVRNDFGNLQNLTELDMDSNDFGSGEPDELAFLSSLTNCTNLQKLIIGANRFRGVLSDSVGNLSTIYLDLAENQLYGTIPLTIGNLVSVSMLVMEYNQFSGTIPTTIGYLKNLQWLSFNHNYQLSGQIPDSIGNLSLLNKFYSGSNRLEGTIPPTLGNCTKLLLLDLSDNNLSGTIPREVLFGLSLLSISLNLAGNGLFGSLPAEVGNLKKLAELDFSGNKLSGEIPSSLGSCISLVNLYLQENFLQGSIPLSLKSLGGIQNFDLSRNNLSGEIPTFLETLSLNYLNLSYNDFEGEVPTKGVFANASAISVAGNYRLCGGIPELQLPSCTTNRSKLQKPRSHAVAITAALVSIVFVVTLLGSFFLICWFRNINKRTTLSAVSLEKESFLRISYEKLLKATDGFSSENLIGFGSFGSVYKGSIILHQDDHEDQFVVAVKVLNLQNRGAIKSFMAECETLRNIRHRNLVRIITSCSSVDFQGNDFKALIYDFMPNGSLERWLHSSLEFPRLNLLQRINIAIDVACALDYLHRECPTPIIHCDIKPSNVLLDSDMIAHVGDFGLARFSPTVTILGQSSSIAIRGTVGYAAPEYGLGSEMSSDGDIYSYGILLLEMVTGKRPTDNMFKEDLALHNFARMALPRHVMEIVDPVLLTNEEEQTRTATTKNGSRIEECLISMVKIGVACSTESPQDRMKITNVLHELHQVKIKLLEDELF